MTVAYRTAADGSTKDIKVQQSSGYHVLDQATTQCVASWQFFPATHDGHPVEIDRVNKIGWSLGP